MKKFICVVVYILFCTVVFAGSVSPKIQWTSQKGKAAAAPVVTNLPASTGKNGVRIEAVDKGEYQGAVGTFAEPIDLGKFAKLEFNYRHNITGDTPSHFVVAFNGKHGRSHVVAVTNSCNWQTVSIPLDKSCFEPQAGNSVNWEGTREMRIYPYASMNNKGKFLEIADVVLIEAQQGPHPLKVMNYKHITKPTSGESGQTLTDADKSKNVVYRQYCDDPDIVFDLGGRFTIDEIKVHANSAPSHNFSEILFEVSYDMENWSAAGVLHNNEQGTERRQVAYTYKNPEKLIVGRYIRVQVSRPRSDFTVELSEFEFTGHTPTQEEITKAAEMNYDTGAAMPPRDNVNYIVLKQNDLQTYVSRRNGVVNGLFFKGELIAERFTPKYMLQTREKDIEIDGNKDVVQKVAENADGSVTLTTVNEMLPDIIIKRTWAFERNALLEKIEVKNAMKERKFLRIATEVILARDFRKNGFYEMPAASCAAEMFRLHSSEVQVARSLTNKPTIAFDNVQKRQVLWHTRYRFNDRFTYMDVGNEEENLQFFNPNGWMLSTATIVPADAETQSIENRFFIMDGSMLHAYDEYFSQPEVSAYRGQVKRPDWLRDLRAVVTLDWDGQYPQSSQRLVANFTDAFSPRGYLVDSMLIDMDGIWGDWPVSGEIRGMFGNIQTAEELQEKIRRLRAMNPKYKMGYYTWVWSVFPWSTPFQKHPEWFVTTLRNKAKASWFPGFNVNYLRFFGDKESRDEVAGQLERFIDFYDQDLWYVDGGKSGTYAKCWDTMRIDDPLGQTDFYLDMRRRIKKNNPERAVFFNHSENPLGDIGFLESFGGTLTNEWRRGAILMWRFKVFSYKDPKHHSVYIYWVPSLDGAFHNYMAGIGVVPSYNSRAFNTRDIPFISARYEIRQAQLAEADIRPDWRNDLSEDLELMALNQGKNGWIFINPHGSKKEIRDISFLTAPLNLNDSGKPIYAWLYTIKNGKEYKGLFGDKQIAKAYQETGWIAERAVVPQYLGRFEHKERFNYRLDVNPNHAQVLMLTQVPAVILSIEGEPSHYYLSSQPGIEISEDNGRFSVISEYNKAEIGLLLPDGKAPNVIKINGKAVDSVEIRTEGNMRFAMVSVGQGESNVEMSLKNAATAETTQLDVALNKRVLSVKVMPKDAPVQIYAEGNLVLSRQGSFELTLPETVRDGKYTVVSGRQNKELSLQKLGTPLHIRPVLVSLPVKSEQKGVNRKIRGIDVHSQGFFYSEGACLADIDIERLTMTAGTLRNIESHYNSASAGIEISAKRYIKLHLKNTFLYHNKYGYEPKIHGVRHGDIHFFGGLMLDFATKAGYTTRSAAGLGMQNEKRKSITPSQWGKKGNPDHIYSLDTFLLDDKADEKVCWIDLESLGAPDDWNGRLFLTLHLELLAPDRRCSVEIIETADALPTGAKALTPMELGAAQPKILALPYSKGMPRWEEVPLLGEMTPLQNIMRPFVTEVKAAQDEQNLYLRYVCHEDEGKILNAEGSKMGTPWEGDGIEFFVQEGAKSDMIIHGIIDVQNHVYVERMAMKNTPGSKKVQLTGKLLESSVKTDKGVWSITISVPWTLVGGRPARGELRGFNMMRNRLEQGAHGYYSLVPGGRYFTEKQYQIKTAE